MMPADSYYLALVARDARFDGVFFVGVTSTGIYCRPICSARRPARSRCVFFPHAAAAEREGFRACFRCRPELAPGRSAPGRTLAEAALTRIGEGCFIEGNVDGLASELGVTARHLRRVLASELGASPVELSQSRRLALAKQLVQDTSLTLAQVAFASGFASVRRFNALFQERLGVAPSKLRRQPRGAGASRDSFVIRLDYRPPLAGEALLAFLARRCTPGVEAATASSYRRTASIAGRDGWFEVTLMPRRSSLAVRVSLSLADVLMPLVARLRALFDLDAQPAAIALHLAGDPALADSVRAHPGLRVPGAFDGFESTVRIVLGQLISVSAATRLSGRLVREIGTTLETPHADLTHRFPSAAEVVAAGADRIASLGMPGSRARALVALAGEVASGRLRLERHSDPAATIRQLQAIPGIGEWTAQCVAMRVLRWPDAFPATDLGVRHACGDLTKKQILARAERWRPWRAYAAMHLWMRDSKEET